MNLRAAGLAALAFACATPSARDQGHPVLVALRFEGNGEIGSGELLSKIVTAPSSGVFSKTVRYYDADLFTIDEKRLIRWYNQKGFYEARIDQVREEPDDQGRVTLVVKIFEGPRARTGKLDFKGTELLKPDELHAIDGQLPIHPGDWFDEDGYEKAKQVFERQLREHGFAEAEAKGQVKVDMEQHRADVELIAESGKRYVFGKVLVSGNRAVPSDEIIRAAGIGKGDLYKPSAMELAQQRIYNLGTFSGVRVSLEPLGESPVAAVRVNVREAPLQTVRLGMGLKIEESRFEIPRLRVEYVNRNFLGGIRRLELASTAGYAFVPSITEPTKTGITTLSSAQLTLPNVLFPGLDFISRGEFAREIQAGFNYDEVAARFSLLFRSGGHSISPALNFVRYFQAALDEDLASLLSGRNGQGIGLLSNCLPACTLTYPELRYTFDARDDLVEPRKGFYATIDLQQTLKPGSFTYFRVEPEVRIYYPLGKWVVAAGRAYYGALFLPPDSDAQASPFTQRFFGGGQNLNRGYAPLRQGPKLGACSKPPCVPDTAVPIGGNGSILFSGELRVRTDYLLKNTALVPFVDASRVTEQPELPFRHALEIAPGLGLRYLTPFGPVRVDVAWLLNPQDVIAKSPGDGVPAVTVSSRCAGRIPCIGESRFAYHISLGEAF